jgi:glycosidase
VTEGWFANTLPDLDQENPAVEQYLIQNAIWWIEQAGLDGLRIDTFPYVGRAFWHDFHLSLHALYPHITTVGEVFNGDATITSTFAGGVTRTGVDTGLDTPFDFPTYFALRDVFLKDAPMTKLADILRLDDLFPHPERLVPFLGNHDTSRFMGEPGATFSRLKLAFTVLTTMRGMPEIYAGDEIAMPGGEDPDNRRDFPGGFGSAQPDAFQASSRTPEEAAMFDYVQKLLTIRRQHVALQIGVEQVLSVDKDVFVYVRSVPTEKGTQHILIAVNKGTNATDVSVPTADTSIAGLEKAAPLLGDAATLTFAPDSVMIHIGGEQVLIADLH